MSPEAFALLVASCGLSLPPGITVERLRTYAHVESSLVPTKISPPNRDGSRDYGLLQINDQHFRRFGVNAVTVMEPCTNLQIGVALLADADRQAACIYNTGRPDCRNGYPARIQAAAAARQPAPIPAPAPSQPAEAWDVWAAPSLPGGRVEAAPADEPRLVVEYRGE